MLYLPQKSVRLSITKVYHMKKLSVLIICYTTLAANTHQPYYQVIATYNNALQAAQNNLASALNSDMINESIDPTLISQLSTHITQAEQALSLLSTYYKHDAAKPQKRLALQRQFGINSKFFVNNKKTVQELKEYAQHKMPLPLPQASFEIGSASTQNKVTPVTGDRALLQMHIQTAENQHKQGALLADLLKQETSKTEISLQQTMLQKTAIEQGITTLNTQLANATNLVATVHDQLHQLTQRHTSVKENLATIHMESQKLLAQKESLEKEYKKKHAELMATRNDYEKEQKRLEHAAADLHKARTELDALKKSIQIAQDERNNAARDYDVMQKNLFAINKKVVTASSNQRALKEKIATAQKEFKSMVQHKDSLLAENKTAERELKMAHKEYEYLHKETMTLEQLLAGNKA